MKLVDILRNRASLVKGFEDKFTDIQFSFIKGSKKSVNYFRVELRGGVFQNVYLLGKVADNLRGEGLGVYTNEIVPCNDAGISLGQAYIVRERLRRGPL